MDELRWVLLGLGVLFIGGLAWWELRKPRHSGQRAADEGFIDAEPQAARRVEPRFGDTSDLTVPQGDLPSMRALQRGDDPPLVMVDSMSEGERTVNISIASDVAVDAPGAAPEAPEMQADSGPEHDVAAAPAEPPPRRGPPEPNWPPEAQRTIISLRVVPRPPARFAGRPLRLAFESCGLEYGAFDIFHLCDDAGEVVASAANLMRPGTFPVETMDAQHFHGVHLFCVLPGPLPPARAVDELIALSRDLAQRLQGLVLDEVGQPLDEERAAEVRARAEGAELAG